MGKDSCTTPVLPPPSPSRTLAATPARASGSPPSQNHCPFGPHMGRPPRPPPSPAAQDLPHRSSGSIAPPRGHPEQIDEGVTRAESDQKEAQHLLHCTPLRRVQMSHTRPNTSWIPVEHRSHRNSIDVEHLAFGSMPSTSSRCDNMGAREGALRTSGRFLMKKKAGVSGGQQNLHIMAIAVPPGIFDL